jgi:hypothetical protein
MLRFIVKYMCSVLLLLGTPVVAEDDDPFDVTLYGSFLHTETVPNALFFFNEIEQYDGFELRRALRNHDIDTVVLASDGGNVFEGLNMAGIIHDKGIITYVPELPDEMGCYSACSFMFFGGKIRQADGVLAVHQAGAYGSDRDKAKEKVSETQQSTQFTVSEIIGFLNEFETPPWVYEKMFRSRDFYEFDEEEKGRLASRTDEIDPQSLYSINGFINAFFKHLEKLESEKENKIKKNEPKVAKPKKPKTSGPSQTEELRATIMEIQKLLNYAGCNAGIVDGIWGRRTQAAALLFAQRIGFSTSDAKLRSKEFIRRLRLAPKNSCPKSKPKSSTRPRETKPVVKKDWYAKYTYTCTGARNVTAVMVVDRSSTGNYVYFTVTFKNGSKYYDRFTDIKSSTAKLWGFPVALFRSNNGKVSSFSFKRSAGTCTGTAR